METITLKAEKRDLLGKKVKNLRNAGSLPAVLYGKKFQPISLSLDIASFHKLLQEAGEATIIDLQYGQKEPVKVLIRDIQNHPVNDDIIHVDLYKVDMTEEIQTEIPLKFEGVSPAVEELEGNLITSKDHIKVECLPNKLVSEIIVDLSTLKTFDNLIHISDLGIPEGIKVLDEGEEIVVQVTPPRSEEELEELESEAQKAAETEKEQIETIQTEADVEKAKKEAEQSAEESPGQEGPKEE